MMFRVEIETGNAAFEGDATTEVARILRKLADRVDGCNGMPAHVGLVDVNGNRCGVANLVGAEDSQEDNED